MRLSHWMCCVRCNVESCDVCHYTSHVYIHCLRMCQLLEFHQIWCRLSQCLFVYCVYVEVCQYLTRLTRTSVLITHMWTSHSLLHSSTLCAKFLYTHVCRTFNLCACATVWWSTSSTQANQLCIHSPLRPQHLQWQWWSPWRWWKLRWRPWRNHEKLRTPAV